MNAGIGKIVRFHADFAEKNIRFRQKHVICGEKFSTKPLRGTKFVVFLQCQK